MRRILSIIFTVFICISVTSCNKKTEPIKNYSTTNLTQQYETTTQTTTKTTTTTKKKVKKKNYISWSKAINHIGEKRTVGGRIAGISYTQYGVFINIGEDYPSSDRFQVVIWNNYTGNCSSVLSSISTGDFIKVKGTITSYNGVAQIKAYSSSQFNYK